MPGTLLQVQMRDAVLEQYTTLLHDLAASEVLELPAGISYVHRCSAVLLQGTIKTSGRRPSENRGGELALPDLEPCGRSHRVWCRR